MLWFVTPQIFSCPWNMMPSTHKRSKSDTDHKYKREEGNLELLAKKVMGKSPCSNGMENKPLPEANVQNSLKHEILQLEKRLQDQLSMRCALEKALGYNSALCSSNDGSSMPKPANELIREIAILELEVMHLEQYLLSLYRKAFDQQTMSSSKDLVDESANLKASTKRSGNSDNPGSEVVIKWAEKQPPLRPAAGGVGRSQSSLSCRAVSLSRISPSSESLARALHSFHYSQPLSFLEEEQNAPDSGFISLAEYLEAAPPLPHETCSPNKLSEDMVRCMASIYCRLAEPPLASSHGPLLLSPSPASSCSSMSTALSPQCLWSPTGVNKRDSTLTLDSRLINPFRVEGLKEFSGPYNAMVEIPLISRSLKGDVDDLLLHYKLILEQLEKVDPKKLKNEEKIAFWINVYNAIIMHAYMEYGIPEGNVKKTSLLIKGMCNIGGRSINAVMIQGYILRCRSHSNGQWLRELFKPGLRHRGGDQWRSYAIQRPEPLLHFALCSGSHSDPAVRIYTCDGIFRQLGSAKEEYIRATVGIWKEQKILLPRVIESYAKDARLSSAALIDVIQHHLPQTLRLAMQKCRRRATARRAIEWVPHDFSFRYLLSTELAFPRTV